MKVNKRLIEIFNLLIQNKKTSIKDICKTLNLNERSVRYEIDNINYILNFNGLNEIEKLEKGLLELEVNDKINRIFSSFTNIAKLSKEDRINYIYINLLLNGKLNISKATKELEVSRTTVKNDLKEVEDELQQQEIVLLENSLISSEQKLRGLTLKKYCIKISELYYSTSFNEYDKCTIEYHICRFLTKDKLNTIKSYVEILAKKFNSNSHEFYEVIFSYLIISYIRIVKGYKITTIENKEFLISTEEYTYLSETMKALGVAIEIDFDTSEVLLLTDYLLGLTSYAYNTTIFQDWLETKMIVRQIIDEVDSKISIRIKHDDILLSGLLNHIKPMIYRSRNGLNIDKELYYQSIEGNFELYEIVKESLGLLERLINTKFAEAEVALFTIHFLAAIRRNEEEAIQFKKVLLVCGGGYGTSGIIKNILEENYNVDIVESISYYQLLKYNMKKIDIIVTTININKEIKDKLLKPVVLVTPFFTFKDDESLKRYSIKRKNNYDYKLDKLLDVIKENASIKDSIKLRKELEILLYGNKRILHKTPETLFELLEEDKIEVIEKLDSWEEALNRCGEKLIRTNEIKEEYMKEIFKVIKTFGAYFVLSNEIAIPHGQFNVNVNNPCMSIMYIKEGVIFPGDMKVKLVILIASSEKNILIKTVERINEISKRSDLYKELNKISNNIELIKYFRGDE